MDHEPAPTPPGWIGRKLPLFGHTVLKPLILFLLTVGSVFHAGSWIVAGEAVAAGTQEAPRLAEGWPFAVPLLAILIAHEFGHYIAARLHRVPASLPYFLPLPVLSPFGTLGAVISMPERIRSRNALLDIGAAGPLAGLVVALPAIALGLSLSTVQPLQSEHFVQEGQSLLYMALKRSIVGPIPAGYDVFLHPTALAGWAGLLITMINLLPWGQLDGGHIAFALFGPGYGKVAIWIRRALIPLFAYNVWVFVVPITRGVSKLGYPQAVSNSLFWLVWFIVLGLIARASGGADHPPFEAGPLAPTRRAVGGLCLVLYLLLFMPTPWAVY